MKHLFYLLLCVLPLLGFTACDDDDDKALPPLDVNLAISGGEFYNGQIYAVRGTTLTIDTLSVTPEGTNKTLATTVVRYYMGPEFVAISDEPPFSVEIPIMEYYPTTVTLGIHMPFLMEGYPIYHGYIAYKVNIVDSEEDLPGGDKSDTTEPTALTSEN